MSMLTLANVSGAVAGTFTVNLSAPQAGPATLLQPSVGMYFGGYFLLNVNAVAAGVGDTLNVYMQHSADEGVTNAGLQEPTWDDFVSFTQVLGNGGLKKFAAHWLRDVSPSNALHAVQDATMAAGVIVGPVSANWRVKYVIVGGTAAFSFTLGFLPFQKRL